MFADDHPKDDFNERTGTITCAAAIADNAGFVHVSPKRIVQLVIDRMEDPLKLTVDEARRVAEILLSAAEDVEAGRGGI